MFQLFSSVCTVRAMSTSRETEQKAIVAQLRSELEQEKSKSKQLHYDKVREVKSTKEREQTIARGQQEELKLKLEKDKDQELKVNKWLQRIVRLSLDSLCRLYF